MTNVTITPAAVTGRATMIWTIRAVCAQRPIHRHVSTATATTPGTAATVGAS